MTTTTPNPPIILPSPSDTTTTTSPATSTLTHPTLPLFVSLTPNTLDLPSTLSQIRTPSAGALVTFTGTTRSTFGSKRVASLSYSAYAPMALKTMLAIAEQVYNAHALLGVAIVHRLGTVPVGEDSVVIAVASKHRGEGWRGGETCLELVKERVEVWKMETFEGDEGSVWRANRDGAEGVRVELSKGKEKEEEEEKEEQEREGVLVAEDGR